MGGSYAQTSAPPASVTAAKPSKGTKLTLRRVSIEVVENGYIGRCSYDAPPVKGRDFPAYVPDKEYALADRKAVDAFLDDMLGLGAKTEPKKKA